MKQTQSLFDKQKKLINDLQRENAPVYSWLVKQGVDFTNFQKSTSSFIAAVSLLFASSRLDPSPAIGTLPPVKLEQNVRKDFGKPKTDTARAQYVWAQYGQFIRESAARYDVDPNLIFATIMIESGGNPYAIRLEPRLHDASYGLGQLLYSTARGLGFTGKADGLFDPEVNIDLIARYHRRNLDHYGHLTAQELTTAYNTGSPYKKPLAGHLAKFDKWYNRIENVELDLT